MRTFWGLSSAQPEAAAPTGGLSGSSSSEDRIPISQSLRQMPPRLGGEGGALLKEKGIAPPSAGKQARVIDEVPAEQASLKKPRITFQQPLTATALTP